MNEININIEGYNVNGICVGCLNYNRKMFYVDEVKDCFRILANIDVPDGLMVQVCWECLASVRRVRQFQAQIMKSFDVLMDYSRLHTFLDCPADLARHAASRLAAVSLGVIGPALAGGQGEPTVDVKPLVDDVKVEFEVPPDQYEAPKRESDDESSPSPSPSSPASPPGGEGEGSEEVPPAAESSDEELRLSQIKRRKDRAVKKVKAKSKTRRTAQDSPRTKTKPPSERKLKNLPKDSVELVTMSEEEMLAVRLADLQSAEFVSLKYKCEDCILGFASKKLMKMHLHGKHQPAPNKASHQCDVCRAHFLTRDNLAGHRALHRSAYACKRCGLRTTLKRVVAGHLKRCRGSAAAADGVSGGCEKCGLTFATKSKLAYHRAVCKQEKPQCDCCGKVFANKLTLKHHLKAVSGGAESRPKEPKEKLSIQCKGCDKVFPSRKSYRAHVVIHDGLQYPCPVCGKLFQWKRNLARHLRNHADREAGARHECRECGKRFSSRDCFNNHMRFSKQHVSEDMFVHGCEYCGKKFATKWCLVDHVDWEHLKNIKYQCSVCLKPFKTAKIMVAHMNNIHEGKKKAEAESEHLCDICGKSYKTVKRLKGHVWAMHTHRSTVKSFKCKLCPATFTWQTSIYKHVKMMHCTNKRSKNVWPPLKIEPYSEMDRTYYQQDLVPNVQGSVPAAVLRPDIL